MPPKKQPQANTAKKKVAVDATFGMKNKKGKKAQEVQKSMQHQGMSKVDQQKSLEAQKRKEEKQAKWAAEEEKAMLFRKVEEKQKPQVVPFGVDPKSVLCIYFKQGKCQNGDKCGLSHDLNDENKSAKRDMYTDTRELAQIEMGDMKDWDEETLRTVLKKKESGRPVNASAQSCKHFINAIESNKWGWFWECPNGNNTCVYRHALPLDYVLKKDQKKEKLETRTLEAVLEEERAALTGTGTKVTPETFAAWKEKNRLLKEKEAKKQGQLRQQDIKSGKVRMTGREVMESGNINLNEDDQEDGDDIDIKQLQKEKEKLETQIDEENAQLAANLAKEVEAELANIENKILDPNVISTKENNESFNNNNNNNNNNDNDNNNDSISNMTKNNSNAIAKPETVLSGVDTSLFTDVQEDIDFSEDDDNEEDNEKEDKT